MSLSCLRDDYDSAQLKTVVLWCDGGCEVSWKKMEGDCKAIPVQAMIRDYKLMKMYFKKNT